MCCVYLFAVSCVHVSVVYASYVYCSVLCTCLLYIWVSSLHSHIVCSPACRVLICGSCVLMGGLCVHGGVMSSWMSHVFMSQSCLL